MPAAELGEGKLLLASCCEQGLWETLEPFPSPGSCIQSDRWTGGRKERLTMAPSRLQNTLQNKDANWRDYIIKNAVEDVMQNQLSSLFGQRKLEQGHKVSHVTETVYHRK